MERNDLFTVVTVVGMAVAIVSFLVYIFNPIQALVYVFVAGMVLMVVGYALASKNLSDTKKALEAKCGEVEARGYIISLDGAYVPERDDAVIEYLE